MTGLDLSLVLRMPAVLLVLSVLMAQGLVGLAACLWLSVGQGTSFSDWRFCGLSHQQQAVLRPIHLSLVAAAMAAMAPFELMVQSNGVVAGAGWVALRVRLPLKLLLCGVLLLVSVGLVVPTPMLAAP